MYNHVYTKCSFLERDKGGYKLFSIDPYQAAYKMKEDTRKRTVPLPRIRSLPVKLGVSRK